MADDPCRVAMRSLMNNELNLVSQGSVINIDTHLTREYLLTQGHLKQQDLDIIENSSLWREFLTQQSREIASQDEQMLIAALIRKSDPEAPVDALQRKYNLLFEFCGL